MKRLSIIILLLTSTAIISFSQDIVKNPKSTGPVLPKAEISVGLQVIIPTTTFGKNIGTIPVGLSGQYFRRLGSKFMLGVELNAACISHAEYEVELDNGDMVTLEETENMWGAMLAGRFNFIGNSAFRTYTEVRVGINI